jgi:hypothetical protein
MLLVRKEITLQVVSHPSGTRSGQSLLTAALPGTLVGRGLDCTEAGKLRTKMGRLVGHGLKDSPFL